MDRELPTPKGMTWLDWNDSAFEEARTRGVPVLLFVKASWCRWCRELERSIVNSPEIQGLIEKSFVAICVDKDRRPDIETRYSLGGWPTLAWLDHTGELLGADNYLEQEELLARLNMVAATHQQGSELLRTELRKTKPELQGAPAPPPSKAALEQREIELSLGIVEQISTNVLETADAVYGGWGKQHKFPHPEAIDFALIRWTQTGDSQMLDLVRRTLRKMQSGEIHDSTEGGFYRYATRADWSVPNTEKMLDSNVQRIFLYLEGYQALGEEAFKHTAQNGLEWLERRLLNKELGVFQGSQDADPEYAHLSLDARNKRGAPPCDPTIFANWNAMAVSTLLKASVVLGQPKWKEHALRILDFLLAEMWSDEKGMHHYYDGHPHLAGMLSDQAYTLRALVNAAQYAGENRFLDAAERLASLTIENLRAENGGFYDKVHTPFAPGGLRRRNRSILENSVMAEALLRLAFLTGERDYEDNAREALASFTGTYRRHGHFVAGYARAVDLLFHQPIVVTVVGPRADARTQALMQAAFQPYIASRIVRTIDPTLDPKLFERSGLPGLHQAPRAFVERGRESYADTDDPRALPALMMRT